MILFPLLMIASFAESTALQRPVGHQSLISIKGAEKPKIFGTQKTTATIYPQKGLKNIGCSCYLNAVMQVLVRTGDYESLLTGPLTYLPKSDKDRKNHLFLQIGLQRVIVAMRKGIEPTVTELKEVIRLLQACGIIDSEKMPQDATEVLSYLQERFGSRLAGCKEREPIAVSDGSVDVRERIVSTLYLPVDKDAEMRSLIDAYYLSCPKTICALGATLEIRLHKTGSFVVPVPEKVNLKKYLTPTLQEP
ncbi:MAG TPA: hypothetical protein VN457_02095, partial [Chlamydiales bacterium]|nr:hypothetical protein [Chlamydiales bacterium]